MTQTQPLGREDLRAFERDAKIGLVATVNPSGLPHVTLITSIQAKSPTQLMFGQFSEGLSKRHVQQNPRIGFLVMSPEKVVWRGKARWTHAANSGEDYETYNQKPMFRYNSYFGIHTVHYLDLIEFTGTQKLAVPAMVAGFLLTTLCRRGARSKTRQRILTPWAEGHISKLGTLKFLSYVGPDGYPAIVPAVPCQAADSRRLVFTPSGQRTELGAIRAGDTVSLFALNLQMESVLVRGVFAGYRRCRGVQAGTIDIDWVYNSMPPKQGPIYPVCRVRPVAATLPHTGACAGR